VRGEWLRRPGIEGVDVGPSRDRHETIAIRVYLAADGPSAHRAEPLPARIGRFPVECIPARFGPESTHGDATRPA